MKRTKRDKIEYYKGVHDIMVSTTKLNLFNKLDFCLAIFLYPKWLRKKNKKIVEEWIIKTIRGQRMNFKEVVIKSMDYGAKTKLRHPRLFDIKESCEK